MDLSPVLETVGNGNGVAVVPVADLCRAVGHKAMGPQVAARVGRALAEAGWMVRLSVVAQRMHANPSRAYTSCRTAVLSPVERARRDLRFMAGAVHRGGRQCRALPAAQRHGGRRSSTCSWEPVRRLSSWQLFSWRAPSPSSASSALRRRSD